MAWCFRVEGTTHPWLTPSASHLSSFLLRPRPRSLLKTRPCRICRRPPAFRCCLPSSSSREVGVNVPPCADAPQDLPRASTAAFPDWRGMSDDEFYSHVERMQDDSGCNTSSMSVEEFQDFCWRRGKMAAKLSQRMSSFYKDVNLIAKLHQLRGHEDELVMPPYVTKKFNIEDSQSL